MKLTNTRNAESTFPQTFESNKFTVAVTCKTFDLLLDQMYEFKIRAIIRELCTNAYDAHLALGIGDQPFHVQLPTSLDPTFSVRDYGVGMSHEKVMKLYTTMFDSDKADTNDQIGAFGLGSKTPFAYVDAYTVTVWLDGQKRVYLIARDADGIPTITHLSTEDSEDPRGVLVSFPVKAEDFREFRDEMLDVGKGFDVKPTVPGLHFPAEDFVLSGDTWKVVQTQQNGVVYIRQGCVIYPYNAYQLSSDFQYGWTIQVDVPVGTAQVAMNREALSLDHQTRDNVETLVSAALDEMQAKLISEIQEADDLFDANVVWHELQSRFRISEATFNGQAVDGVIRFEAGQNTTPVDVYGVDRKREKYGLKFKVSQAKDLRFLIDRSDQVIKRKIARFYDWRGGLAKWEKDLTLILKDPTSKQLAALVRRLHLRPDQIMAWSSLPDVEVIRAPRGSKVGKDGKGRIAGAYRLDTKELITEIPKSYLWVPIERINAQAWDFGPENGGRFYGKHSAWSHLHDVHRMINTSVPVLLLTPTAQKSMKPSDDDLFFDAARAFVVDNAENMAERYQVQQAYQALPWALKELAPEILGHVHPDPAGVRFGDRRLAESFGLDLSSTEDEVAKITRDLHKRYPLLFNNSKDDIRDYIRMRNEAAAENVAATTTNNQSAQALQEGTPK